MAHKKTFFLLSSFIFFSTNSLYSMQNQEEPRPEAAHQNSPKDRYYEAQTTYWHAKNQRDTADQEMSNMMNSFKGFTEKAIADKSVALGFTIIDRGLCNGYDAARKKMFGLSEEEILALETAKTNKAVLEEALNEKKANTELNNCSARTQNAQREHLESQKIFQDIMTAEKACSLMDDQFDNPACQKRLRELFAKAGIVLPEEK